MFSRLSPPVLAQEELPGDPLGSWHLKLLGHSQHILPGKLSTNDTATRRKPSAIHSNPLLAKNALDLKQLPENKFWCTENKGLAESFLLNTVYLNGFSSQERPVTFAED